MFAKTRDVDGSTFHSVCWAFPELREELLLHGVIPSVCTATKALANCYNNPFLNICGRASNGVLSIYFVGCIPSEDTEGITWFIMGVLAHRGLKQDKQNTAFLSQTSFQKSHESI